MERFNVQLILKFDGSPDGLSVVKRLEKMECACKLCKIKESATVISLRLTEGAYTVYQQFRDEADLDKIQHSFYKASGMDAFAWQQFVGW